ncbi:MAG: hypothetical protein J6B32_07035 [Spirochaetaceae bacterium]|nr:hypothetical protein [Spirochaetaceae bacterium]
MKAVFAFLLFYLLFFLGCSNPQTDIEQKPEDYDNTLRKYLELQAQKIVWTEEIEPNVISEKKKKDAELFGSSRYSIPEVASVLNPLTEDLVFPGIEGLGLLDISTLDNSLRTLIDNFCNELITISSKSVEGKKSVLYNSFIPEQNYILTIFLYDIENLPAFTKYLIFAPCQEGEYTKIWIRFFSQEGYLDIELYGIETSQGWRFQQIKYGVLENE